MMTEALTESFILLSLVTLVLLIVILLRLPRTEKISALSDELRVGREEAGRAAKDLRDEISRSLKDANDTLSNTLAGMSSVQCAQLDAMTAQILKTSQSNYESFERFRTALDGRISDGLNLVNERLSQTLNDLWQVQRLHLDDMGSQLKDFGESNQSSLDRICLTLDSRVKELQESNEKKLEDMRRTVDEKLHQTLEDRLQSSFATVSERLEEVHKGLGEMRSLATGVGDLQRVLTNVKVRGTWAEVQLGSLLDQILAPGQYERNVRVKADSGEAVEYAVRLPGNGIDPSTFLWLPIDSKFPQEDYRRVQEAADRADPEQTKKAVEDLVRTIRAEAQKISERYINPPATTDFAIMFLATEGLYVEALRQPSLVEELQRRCRIVIAGPTTLIAILNSLRMGFRTLAIEQRASEVANVLRAVKTEFGKFNLMLESVKRQLNTATRTIEESGFRRTRAMERRLQSVEQLPEMEAAAVLQISDIDVSVESDEDEREVLVSPQTG